MQLHYSYVIQKVSKFHELNCINLLMGSHSLEIFHEMFWAPEESQVLKVSGIGTSTLGQGKLRWLVEHTLCVSDLDD